MKKRLALAKELSPDSAQWAITTPYPGSEMFDDFRERIGKVDDWSTFLHANPLYPGKGAPAVILTDVPPEILHKYVMRMTKYFTLRPKRIVRNILKTRSLKELLRQMEAGMRLAIGR